MFSGSHPVLKNGPMGVWPAVTIAEVLRDHKNIGATHGGKFGDGDQLGFPFQAEPLFLPSMHSLLMWKILAQQIRQHTSFKANTVPPKA